MMAKQNIFLRGKQEPKAPKVLEALAASGLRALRYAREVEGIGKVIALDNDKALIEACDRNIKFNDSVTHSKVEAYLADARVFMLTHLKEFDVMDFFLLSAREYLHQFMELHNVPLFVSLHSLCSTLKCTSPPAVVFRSAVINAGFQISGSHVNPLGLKTDAPMDVIWDIMRCWVKNHPVKAQPQDNSGTVILAKEPKLQANFARAAASLSKAKVKKEVRYLPNPERHWGPKVKAGRQITSKHSSLLGPDILSKSLGKEAETEAEREVEQDEQTANSNQEGPATKRQKTTITVTTDC